jgi:predicted TPR repeat methyltransferase
MQAMGEAHDTDPQPPAGARSSGERRRAVADAYDEEAGATGWFGPETAFGLAYASIRPGESIVDLGIGTGLAAQLFRAAGLQVTGVDVATEMLDACRGKGLTRLVRHDLTVAPYPFASRTFDHAVCVWVMQFMADLSVVFAETARLLRPGGTFVFVAGDRSEDEPASVAVGSEHTGEAGLLRMHRHSTRQIFEWLDAGGFLPLRDLAFGVPMDRERKHVLPARAYLARKGALG